MTKNENYVIWNFLANKVIFSANFTIISKKRKFQTEEYYFLVTKKAPEKQLPFYLVDSLLKIIPLRNILYSHKAYQNLILA